MDERSERNGWRIVSGIFVGALLLKVAAIVVWVVIGR